MYEELLQKLANKSAQVGVVGLGYVGLPLVRALVDAGYSTLGFDVDETKIRQLREGRSYVRDVPDEWISAHIESKAFYASADMANLGEPDVLLICVPTPLDVNRQPDLRFVESTSRRIANHLRVGQLVVLESTTYPGTTRDVILPILQTSGLSLGKDYFLAYSPERQDPGNPVFTTRAIPKVVGGCDEQSLELACGLYENVVPRVVPVSSCEVAEASKILENTYRAVNIALVNELKKVLDKMDVDVWEVIDAAATKPFGFQPFYLSPGWGGHCIPIDPFYLSWLAEKLGQPTRFIELAGEVNASMPHYVVDKVQEAFARHGKAIEGSKICLLGIAYKKDVDDPRESPSFELLKLLREGGANLTYNDPHFPQLPKMRNYENPPMSSQDLTEEFLAAQDCLLIATDHSDYDYDYLVRHANLVVDSRGATRHVKEGREKIWPA